MWNWNFKHLFIAIIFVVGTGLLNQPIARAVNIEYMAEQIAASDWNYHYTLTNDLVGEDIEEFTIYFDSSLYANLTVNASPADWDSLVVQPDNGIPADGYFDSLALVHGIHPGNSLSGFSVSFTFLGTATPGSQPFEVVDPISFEVIDSGNTQVSAIPEPNAYLLLVAGLAFLSIFSLSGKAGTKRIK